MVCWYTLQHRWALETCQIKEARHEDHTRFQLQEMSQTGKSIDTESRLGVAREQGAGGVGSDREQVPVTLWGWWECSGSKSGGVHTWGFLDGSVVKNMSASEADTRDTVSVPGLGRSIHWRRKWQPTPVFLSGKSHGQRSLAGYSPWSRKESDTTEHMNVLKSTELYTLKLCEFYLNLKLKKKKKKKKKEVENFLWLQSEHKWRRDWSE